MKRFERVAVSGTAQAMQNTREGTKNLLGKVSPVMPRTHLPSLILSLSTPEHLKVTTFRGESMMGSPV